MPVILPAGSGPADRLPGEPGRPGPSRMRRARGAIVDWSARPLPAYAAIVLLQLKVVWGMWWVRDLTTGDTSAYFVGAYRWYLHGSHDLVWSPSYAVYYGSFLYFTADAHVATIAHRLFIVVGLALLVLALMRRLLEPRIAWLTTAWWVVLPVNHDVLYEVHLFSVMPVVVTCLVLLGPPSPWRRGAAVAMLLAGFLLVRNELIMATALLAAACAIFERRAARVAGPAGCPRLARYLFAYGLPVAAVLLMPVALYRTSPYDVPELLRRLGEKHTLNVCQIYAYGYQQRNPGWQKSPWVECQELMRATFGHPQPSMAGALRANRRAMLKHLGWNAGLIPNGLQVLLFNSTWGTVRPGYEPIAERSTAALALSVVLSLLYVGGAVALARDWRYWWPAWLRPRMWGWLVLAFASAGCLVVMVTQRPRPAYLFTLELFLQAIAGLCAQILVRRWNLGHRLAAVFPLLVVSLLAVVPAYYGGRAGPPPRPLFEAYRALAPYQAAIQAPGTVVVTPGYGFELCAYLRDGSTRMCRSLDYYALRGEAQTPDSWWALLATRGANMLYANEAMTGDLILRQALAGAEAAGWDVVMRQTTERGERMLLRKGSLAQAVHPTPDLESQAEP